MADRIDFKLVSTYRPRTMRRTAIFVVSAALAYSTAFAQEEVEEVEPRDRQSAAVRALAEDDRLADAAALSHDQKRERTEKMLGEMRSALQRATSILAQARSSKDVVQLNCVNEKLAQIKGLLKIGEQSSVRMYEAMAQAADDVVNHEYTKLAVAHQKTLILRAEADQCVGESSIYTGDTEIDVEIDPTLTEGDPTATPFPEVSPEIPEVASLF